MLARKVLKNKKDYFHGIQIVIYASEDGAIYTQNGKVVQIAHKKLAPLSYFYEIQREKEPLITHKGGEIDWIDYGNQYKYIAFNFFVFGECEFYKKGDIIAFICLTDRLPTWFFPQLFSSVYSFNKEIINPTEKELYELKIALLREIEREERAKKQQAEAQEKARIQKLEAEENARIQKEEQEKEALLEQARQAQAQRDEDERQDRLEKMRLERENEALEQSLKIQNEYEAERLRLQTEALKEEARLTLEILEIRERIERQDLDATTNTVAILKGLFEGGGK